MKNLILLAIVIGLFMVGTARADGAWVLWEKQYISESKGLSHSVVNAGGWEIRSAYPTYRLCLKAQKENFITGSAIQDTSSEILYSFPYEYTMVVINSKDGTKTYITQELKCLPESVDPRK